MNGQRDVDIDPQNVAFSAPASPIAFTFDWEYAWFFNTTGSTIHLTLTDNQTSAKTFFDNDITTKQTIVVNLGKSRMKNGVTWQASATGLNGYIRGKQ